ncbi:hypothetical protein Tco_1263549 [Tanacetum coccineum]
MPLKRNNMTAAVIDQLIAQRVPDALVEYEANQNSGNGNGSHDSGIGNRRTLHTIRGALTWWNSHIRTVGHDAAYGMPWKTLMKMMTETYCLKSEIKKLESELTVPDEADKVERYAGGLLDNIQGSVMASKPKMLQEAIELARSLIDQKVRAYVARQADNKRRMDNNPTDNHVQQPPYKR